jgi:antitoxin CptB
MNELARLRWRCRRGTREMDILLQSFLDNCYMELSEENRKIFEMLLEESDVDILDWVLDRRQPVNSDYHGIIRYLQTMVMK